MKGFAVIDNKTGNYPDCEEIALNEDWAKHLCYCDIDSFAITEDGSLILMDDCGKCAYCPEGRFTIATDNNVGSKWIPVTERLPEEEGWYLVYTTPNREHKSINKAMFCKGYAWGNFEPYWHGAGGHWANVTHWMPLPQAPKGE